MNTHTHVTCARSHSACEMFSFPKLQHFLAHLHAGLQMISISHLSVPNANFPRPVPLLRPASTRTMGSSLRASASARHASYTASALRGGRSGRVIRAAPVRSGDLQKRKSGSLARAAGRARTCWTASALPARYAPILASSSLSRDLLRCARRCRTCPAPRADAARHPHFEKQRACQRVRLMRRDRAGARERGPSRARSRALAVRIDACAPASAALAPCCLPHPYLILSQAALMPLRRL